MTKENPKKAELISGLIQEFLEVQEKMERNAEIRYYRHNVSLEALEAFNVQIEMLATEKPGDVLDEMMKDNDDYGLLDVIENEQLASALEKIKEFDLTILDMRYRQGLYLKEVATSLEKGLSTICRRIDSALETIKRDIESGNK